MIPKMVQFKVTGGIFLYFSVAMLQREVDRTQPEMKTLRDTCENLNAKLDLSEQLTEKYK